MERAEKPIQVTLTFNLPEHEQDLKTAMAGRQYQSLLWDLDQFLRSAIKYGDDSTRATYYQEVREYLYAEIDGRGLRWD